MRAAYMPLLPQPAPGLCFSLTVLGRPSKKRCSKAALVMCSHQHCSPLPMSSPAQICLACSCLVLISCGRLLPAMLKEPGPPCPFSALLLAAQHCWQHLPSAHSLFCLHCAEHLCKEHSKYCQLMF